MGPGDSTHWSEHRFDKRLKPLRSKHGGFLINNQEHFGQNAVCPYRNIAVYEKRSQALTHHHAM